MDILTPLPTAQSAQGNIGKTVTVLVHRSLPKAQLSEFLSELEALLTEFALFPGALGSQVFQQEEGETVNVSVIQRFATSEDHQAWLNSDTFSSWKESVAPPRFSPDHVRRYYGLEALFDTSPSSPPRWKMAVILMLAVFPLSFTMSKWFGALLGSLPPLVGAMMTTPIMVVLMTYVMVPIVTRVFRDWLHR